MSYPTSVTVRGSGSKCHSPRQSTGGLVVVVLGLGLVLFLEKVITSC